MTETIKVDPLKRLYIQTRQKLIPKDELLENDLTEFFYRWLESKIKRKELLNLAIRGEVATGKNTVAIKLMWKTQKLLQEIYGKKQPNAYERIFSDQTEFIRFIHGEQQDTAVVIDEFNRMAETGLNATTETHLFDYYSDVFAQKNIHRFACAPYYILDKNTHVVLDILTPQKDKGITTCKLLYRDPTERQMVFLGIIHVDVKDVIKQPFYKKYRTKKFRRMGLLDKHGVRDIRELEFAGLIIQIYERLRDVAKIGRVNHDTVLSTTTQVIRKNKRIYSLLTKQELASRTRNLLALYTELHKLKRKDLGKGNKMTEQERQTAITTIKQLLKEGLQEEHNLSNIYEKYNKIT